MPDTAGVGVRRFTGFRVEIIDRVAVLTLDRPELGNPIASAAIPELAEVFTEAGNREDIRALLIRAEGHAFSVGGDVKGFAATVDQSPQERHDDYYARMDRARVEMEAFIALPVPVVVACQGAVAGAAVAWLCGADIVLAAPDVRLVFPHIRLALPPDGGLSWLLPRVVGVRKALELTLTAATLDSDEALRLGLVSRIVPVEALQQDALALARRLAGLPRRAATLARSLYNDSLSASPGAQLAAERDAVAECVADADFAEGVRAFLEKRRPDFPSSRTR